MSDLLASWRNSSEIVDGIYIPKYYDDDIERDYAALNETHDVLTIGELVKRGVISMSTGHEIGKAAYGTGDIPFVRTSDIANWELKTAPKQGVSQDIYDLYAKRQNVQVGDILIVRDGTYLIGRNCFITDVDRDLIYQSHVVKIHVRDSSALRPEVLFLALNSPLVQREIRSKQFTADIIDTIGQRINEVRIPVPRDGASADTLADACARALATRSAGKALIKQMPSLVEKALQVGHADELREFLLLETHERAARLTQRTVTSEFGEFTSQWVASTDIVGSLYMPKYYDHSIAEELARLKEHCDLRSISSLIDAGDLTVASGVEPGKAVYGTGEIPFLRTSDFTNWEVAGDPKQGVSEGVYAEFSAKASLADKDVLLVRDGTYLVGSSCIVTDRNPKALFSGGLLRFRVVGDSLSPYLLLALLNAFIVKRQLRSKQFTRDVIDTLGHRYREVVLPIPRSQALRDELAEAVRSTVQDRVEARDAIRDLSVQILSGELAEDAPRS